MLSPTALLYRQTMSFLSAFVWSCGHVSDTLFDNKAECVLNNHVLQKDIS